MINMPLNRRRLLAAAGSGVAVSMFPAPFVRTAAAATEIVHWSPNTASDGVIWDKMIEEFNNAHAGAGVRIRREYVSWDDIPTKLLTAAASGQAPDFGWGNPSRCTWARDRLTVRLDDLAKSQGLDLADFTEFSLSQARFPKYAEGLYQIPTDIMCLQPLVNTQHVQEAGLSMEQWPENGADLINFASKLTKKDGDKVSRSGILMTLGGLQPAVTWGIVAEQMGFKRVNDDYTEACINMDAGLKAIQWVLDLFDAHRVSSRDVTDRYKAFGNGLGSIFWTGPWTLAGYQAQNLPFEAKPFPKIGNVRKTYFEMGALEMYTQKDTGRYKATMDAIKWLSDNSFAWTTGRGVSPRKSTLARPDYKTAGTPWKYRGAFVEGLEYATIQPSLPIQGGNEFNIYSSSNILAKTLEQAWARQVTPEQAMAKLKKEWTRILSDL